MANNFPAVGQSGDEVAVTTAGRRDRGARRNELMLSQKYNVSVDGGGSGSGNIGWNPGDSVFENRDDFEILDYDESRSRLDYQPSNFDEEDQDPGDQRPRASSRASHRSEMPGDKTLIAQRNQHLLGSAHQRGYVRPTELIRRAPRRPGTVVAQEPEKLSDRRFLRTQKQRLGKVQASSGRRLRWPSFEGMGLGAAFGYGVGALAVGAVAVATGGIGLVVVGAILASTTGAGMLGGAAGSAFMRGPREQKTHLDAALRSLEKEPFEFTVDEAERLTGITDAQWRSLLHVPRSQVADHDTRQELREALVVAAARHGYARASRWKAYAKELRELTPEEGRRLDGITDEQRAELLRVPADQVPDPAGRQIVRRSLVLTAAKHGYDTAMAKKPLAFGAQRYGLMIPGFGPIDVCELHARLQLGDGTNLYGHAYDQIDKFVDQIYRVWPQGEVDPQTDLSMGFLEHIGTPQLRVTLIDSERKRTALEKIRLESGRGDDGQGDPVAAAFKRFVGDQDGDGAAVARNLSKHFDSTAFLRPDPDAAHKILVSEQGQAGRIKGLEPILHYTVEQGSDGYVVHTHITMPFREVEVGGRRYAISDDSKMVITSAIRLKRSDLAANRRDYAWEYPIVYDISEKDDRSDARGSRASDDGSSRAQGRDDKSPSLPKLHAVAIPQRPGAPKRRRRIGSAGDERRVTFLDEIDPDKKLKIRIDPPPPERKPEQPPKQHTRTRSQSVDSRVGSEPATSSSSSARGSKSGSAEASGRLSQTSQQGPARSPEVTDDDKVEDR